MIMRKRWLHHSWILLLFLLPNESIWGQLTISGRVVDSVSGEALATAYVIASRQSDDVAVSYAMVDNNGQYTLAVEQAGSYKIRFSYLGYEPLERFVIYDGLAERQIELVAGLVLGTNRTNEVVVTAERPPIIVQGDTTTFSVQNWAEVDDEDLEAVLRKMPGFTVSDDGELSYNGKVIEKVLIDGKEVANVGAALLTRGVAADKVASVQVREKDQNNKLKRSLLDADGVMVLDITLKKAYQQSTFGRGRAGVGLSPYARPLGYVSAFHLQPKQRWHLLAEYDAYGNAKISMRDIKNLGREAYTELFSTPADFSRLKAREDYDREIYGFSQFEEVEDATLALSYSADLNDKTRLFIGSYQNLDGQTARQTGQLEFFVGDNQTASFQSATNDQIRQFDSKNKVEVDYTSDSLKVRYNLNALYATGELGQNSIFGNDGAIAYQVGQSEYSIYQNLHLDLVLGTGALSADGYFGFTNARRDNDFVALGIDPSTPFTDERGNVAIEQTDREKERVIVGNVKYQLPLLGKLPVTFGVRQLTKQISGTRKLLTPVTEDSLRLFSADSGNSLTLSSLTPYLSTVLPLGEVFISAEAGYNYYRHPDRLGEESVRKSRLLEYDFRLGFDPGAVSLVFSLRRQASAFPLAALREGWTLKTVNSIFRPAATTLQVQPERVAQFSASTSAFKNDGIELDAALAYGETNASPILSPTTGPLIISQFAQNPASYWVGVLKQSKVWNKRAFELRLEQGYVSNTQVNQVVGAEASDYETTFSALLLKSQVDYRPAKKTYGGGGSYSYSNYGFTTSTGDRIADQQQHQVTASGYLTLLKGKLKIQGQGAGVWLDTRGGTNNFYLIDAAVRFTLPSGLFRLRCDNIFDIRQFEQRTIDPVVLSIQRQSMFGRAVWMTYQFDF